MASQPVSALTPAVGLVVVVVGFGAWWTYSDFAGQHRPRPEPAPTVQWLLGHLPLTAAVAAMGAAMVSLVDHAHDGRTPAATAWVLSAGAAVMLGTTMLVAASLQAWEDKRGLYRPLARTSGVAAVACLGVGAARPTPSSSASRSFSCSASPGDSPSRAASQAEPIHPAPPRPRDVWFESGVTRLATASVK